MRARLALGIAVAVTLFVVGAVGYAEADVTVSQVGWWTRSSAPPTVPEGGIAVGAAPDGDLSVGAVMVDLGDGASGTSLRLIETGGQGQQVAVLQVCATSTSWGAAEGGEMADAPEGQCDRASVPMERGDDGSWRAVIQPLVEGATGEAAVLIKPAEGVPAFQLAFAPPVVEGATRTSSDGAEDPATESSPLPDTSSAPASPAPAPAPPDDVAVPDSPLAVAPVDPSSSAAPAPASPTASGYETATVSPTEFQPALDSSVNGSTRNRVTKATMFWWFIGALLVGGAAAGLSWARAEGQFTPARVLSLVRRPR